jgi:DNA replication and repair protein RecF
MARGSSRLASSASDLGERTARARVGEPVHRSTTLDRLTLSDVRAYAALDLDVGPGPQLVWGPNAAGKTSLLEAMVVLARGGSHRTTTDGELIRWGADVARIEGRSGADQIEVALVRPGSAAAAGGARKRIRVNGVARRAAALAERLRVVLFAPEDMLLVTGSPSLRRATVDLLASTLIAGYAAELATYGRALQQRNGLLRAIRDETAAREELRYWDRPFLEAGGAVVAARRELLRRLAGPLAAAHAEIAPEEAASGALGLEYVTNALAGPDESPHDALARRLAETAEKELWNGTTLVGPHRDDVAFVMSGRDLSAFASRGQQRTAILAVKLAELDLVTAHDGRPPLLLLDDVFSELDPDRRSHLVRRIADLPQAFVTTTTLDDLDPALRAIATPWAVRSDAAGARLVRAG